LATHIITFILGVSRLDNEVFSPYRELSALRATALWAQAFISELKVMMSGATPISNISSFVLVDPHHHVLS
jgi:hypothetical protein